MSSRRRRRTPLEECYGRWRVTLSEGLAEELDPHVLQRLLRAVEELEESLNDDRRFIFTLLREPIVHEELRIRRMRLGDYRVLFEIILVDRCLVRILVVEHRSRVYRNLRRRWT